MDDLNKNENMSSISDQKDHLQVQIKEIFRDTLGIFYDSFAKTGWLRCRSIKATAKIYPKSIEQRQSIASRISNIRISNIRNYIYMLNPPTA